MDFAPRSRRLRSVFDEAPELYDRARPGYPAPLFDDLAALARLTAGARVVEIGCGTGQATRSLAERGYRVTCVELGSGLAALARQRLAGFPAVEVVNAPFEAWRPEVAGFDACTAFTAFHWLDPDRRYPACAAVLRPGGALAVVVTQHVLPEGGDPFFVAVQEDYRAVLPGGDETWAGGPPRPDNVPDMRSEIDASGLFGDVALRRYLWEVRFDADGYVALLRTFSDHRALDGEQRAELEGRIRRRIEARHGGTVRKTYLAMLHVARLHATDGT